MTRSVQFLYFASVRDRIGTDGETLDMPDEVTTGAELITWLRGRGDNYDHALAEGHCVRMAADQRHIEPDAQVGAVTEIAFFPPMTGG